MTDLIERHLDFLEAAARSRHTVEDREKFLRRLERELPNGLEKANTEELQYWLGRTKPRTKKRWSTKTKETYWTHMVGFFRWAVGKHLDFDPTEDMARPRAKRRLPRPVTAAQLRLALDQLDPLCALAVLLAAAVGMRAGEVADAEREDFTEERVLIVGKGEKSRSVPTDPLVWATVRVLPDGPLIVWRGHRVDGDWLSRHVSAHLSRIGLPDVTLHRYRHWFGTTLQREYRDLQLTADLMGHSSTVTTCGYAQLTDGHRRLGMMTVSAALTATLKGAA